MNKIISTSAAVGGETANHKMWIVSPLTKVDKISFISFVSVYLVFFSSFFFFFWRRKGVFTENVRLSNL